MGSRLTDTGINTVPYFASAEWYGVYFRSICAGEEECDARRMANDSCCRRPRDVCRTLMAADSRLSLPLEGGASVVKRGISPMILSGHGNWRHTHLGALDAILGRTPFHRHLMPAIREIFDKYGDPGSPLPDLTERLHMLLIDFLALHEAAEVWKNLSAVQREAIERRAGELAALVNPAESMMSAAMRIGREAIFPLLLTLNP